ncbi:nucleotide-binding domain-containing protein [Ganoderma leucocontextum]|nr:nucleotide-binding domain-containing protein [Ganoderma leucocontextum]
MPATVILGAGIIGLSSAHALARIAPPDHKIHLVEPAPELFSSASGKAAGFLAKDWFVPAIAPLAALSFELHRALAETYGGRARWGYSESLSYSLDHAYQSDDSSPASSDASEPSGRNGSQGQGGLDWLLSNTSRAAVAGTADRSEKSADDLPPWLLAKPAALEAISDRKSTAQVVPRRLCEFLLEQCLAAGVVLHHPARATMFVNDERDPEGMTRLRIEYSAQQQSESLEGRSRVVDIRCESLVVAAGCWTPHVYATLFPNASRMPRITHLAGYSVTFKTKHWPPTAAPPSFPHGSTSPCHAVFTDTAGFAPEIFSRANGDVWLGGLNPAHTTLPKLPTDAHVDPAEVDRLLAVGHALCGEDIQVTGEALCFRPVSATGRPIIARMHEADLGDGLKPHRLDGQGGVFVATGHGPWGIALSLGTGQVVAEMVLGRETSADVEQLSRW